MQLSRIFPVSPHSRSCLLSLKQLFLPLLSLSLCSTLLFCALPLQEIHATTSAPLISEIQAAAVLYQRKPSGNSRKKPARRGSAQRNRTPAPPPRKQASIEADSVTTGALADGVTHYRIVTKGDHIANVVSVDLRKNARIVTSKSLERNDGLEAVRDLFPRLQGKTHDTILAATNASFWRAGSNTPIGVTITNGEAIEMPGYKSWSTLLLFDDGSAAIDRVKLDGTIYLGKRRRADISAINRRSNESDIVVYNHYYGPSVPRGTRLSDSAIIAEVLANRVSADIGDETETIDTVQLIRDYRIEEAREDSEMGMVKIACTFPSVKSRRQQPGPSIGDTMKLVVTAVDTGMVAMPEQGFIISAGTNAGVLATVQPGDTIALHYHISPQPGKRIRDAITATPRLVRNGIAGPEQGIEGSKARRFVDGELSRSAIGISRSGDTLFLATIDSPSRDAGTTGMTLNELADFMVSIGAYQAMNLDGGGSATMVIAGETISRQGGRPFNRRVSNSLVVIKPDTPSGPTGRSRRK